MKLVLLSLFAAVAFGQINILVPDPSLPGAQINGCTSGAISTCTLQPMLTASSVPAFQVDDTVYVGNMIESTGSVLQYSAINSPAGVARKVRSISGTSITFKDLSGTALGTSNTVLPYSGFVRRAVVGTLTTGPLGLLDGLGGRRTTALSCGILNTCLTSIVVLGSTATVTYAYNHNLSTGNTVQVRNASDSALNGQKTVTVTGAKTFTFSTTAAPGTYTDTNLTVSEWALDTISTPWESVKYYIANYVTFPYATGSMPQQITGDAIGNQFLAVAEAWYVDPSLSTYLTYAKAAAAHIEDQFAIPNLCDQTGTWCNNASAGSQLDYPRLYTPRVMTAFDLIAPQLSGPEITAFANFWLNNRTGAGQTCTSLSSSSYSPGTLTMDGTTAVVGSGTTFTDFSQGDYLLVLNPWVYVRIASIADNTHLTITGSVNVGSGSGLNYIRVPPFQSTDCGFLWFSGHHLATDGATDGRFYFSPLQTGDILGWVDGTVLLGDWTIGSGNNQTLTASAEMMAAGTGLCGYDSRACDILQREINFAYDVHGPDYVQGWAGFTKAGAAPYTIGRTGAILPYLLSEAVSSVPETPNLVATGTAEKAQIYNAIYDTLPYTLTGSAAGGYGSWGYGGSTDLSDTEGWWLGWLAPKLSYVRGTPEADYLNAYLQNIIGGFWRSLGGGALASMVENLLWFDPNASTATSPTTLPTQLNLVTTDSASCASFGLNCISSLKYQGAYSRSAWGFAASTPSSATEIGEFEISFPTDHTASPDHGNYLPGNFHISKATTNNTSVACLIGDDGGLGCTIGYPNGGYPHQDQATGLVLGDSVTWPATTYATQVSFAGAAQSALFGDSASRYFGTTWDLTPMFGGAVTSARQASAHLKKSGSDEFYILYDSVAGTGANPMKFQLVMPQSSTFNSGTATYSAGLATSTNSDGFRAISKFLNPTGGNALAVIDDGTAYTNGTGGSHRVTACASADGSTCAATPTAFEVIISTFVGTSATSTFTSTLLSPDSNWTGVQLTGPNTSAVALFARGGTRHSTLTGFTTTHAGTAPYLISGLAPGAYTIAKGGSPVSGSPFTVVDGDYSLYFESTAGALTVNGVTEPQNVLGGGVLSGGAVIRK